MKETFTGKPFKFGNSTVITIPSFLIKNERVTIEKEYKITITEVE